MCRIIALFTAILLDVIFGELPNRFHPVSWMGKWVSWSSRKALAIPETEKGKRFAAGVFLMLGGMVVFGIPVFFLSRMMERMPFFLSGIAAGILLKPMFSLKGLFRAAKEIENALSQNDLNEARRLVSWHLVSRDTSKLSGEQVASAAVESVAENLTDAFASPLTAFFCFGLAGAWIYRLINTADAMIGYHTQEWEYIGKFAARMDDVVNWIPARFSAVLIVLCAFILQGSDGKKAFAVMKTDHGKFSSPNAGWTISAAAGALNVHLEKIGCYSVNEGGKAPEAADIDQSCRLVLAAEIITVLLLAACMFI